jgi:hypothetical protein
MSIDPETLMAFADGELDALSMKRVEKAIAADPALGEQVDRHRALSASLRAAFAPVEAAPVPAGVAALLNESAKVVPFTPRAGRRERPLWLGAMAASLVVGLFTGPFLFQRGGGDITFRDGQAVAQGEVAKALDTQLASTQADGAPVRIGVTFRDTTGTLCRTFERGSTGGIACAGGAQWRVERLYGGVSQSGSTYRQAGSASAAMMAEAQAMMAGDPLDADAEAKALAARKR